MTNPPDGWRVERVHRASGYAARTDFLIYEDGGATWDNGSPRDALTVELTYPYERFGAMSAPEISWPSTSDKRPALARTLAVALAMAAEEADSL